MPGESDLTQILASLQPELSAESYIFAVADETLLPELPEHFALVREAEGLSLIIDSKTARLQSLPLEPAFRKITLKVHSSLTATGLTASVSTTLAKQNIACNIVAGFYHDHLFVPEDRAEDALELLMTLSTRNKATSHNPHLPQ